MTFSPLPNNRGVTLIELIIVIAIIGILSGLAGPNFSRFMAEQSLAGETRRVIGALKLARSEARTRGSIVTMSRSGNNWTGAIDIYVDVTAANDPRDANDDLVRQESASNRNLMATDDQNSSDQWISFNMKGWLAEANPILIAICSPLLNASSGMYIAVNRVGKIRERRIGTDSRGCNP